MFTDGRSRKVVFVAHCLLNQNAISDQTAVYPAAFRDVVDFFLERDVGIVQMPCPELCCLGLDRGDPAGGTREVTVENTRIRAAMADPGPHEMLMRLADGVAANQRISQARFSDPWHRRSQSLPQLWGGYHLG